MTDLIDSIYRARQVVTASGEIIPLDSEISPAEGGFLHGLVGSDPTIRRTLEVGCAYGLSSLHLCEALRGREGARHVILDPFQKSQWKGVGLRHLDQAGILFYEWLEERSEFALPRLAEHHAATFDLVFIDGLHTFDHTLIDAFYSLRLLRVGGILVIDDCDFPGIDRVVRYLTNYPSLRIHATLDCPPPITLAGRLRGGLAQPFFQAVLPHDMRERHRKRHSMVAFRKAAEDDRAWNWYAPF